MNAKATLITRSLEDKRVIKPTPVMKSFDCTQIVQNGLKADFAYETRTTPAEKSHDPFAPSPAMVAACYAPIKDSNGLLLKKPPLKTGVIPTKLVGPSMAMREANNKLPEHLRRCTADASIISGGWAGARLQFERFCSGVFTYTKSYNRISKYIYNVDKRMDTPKPLMAPRKHEIFFMPFRGASQVGGDLTHSFKDKSQGWFTACTTAHKLWDIIHKKPVQNGSFYTLGGREKVITNKKPGTRLQSRLVCMQDQVEFAVAKPYVRAIENLFFKSWNGPFAVGRSLTGNRYDTLLSKLRFYDYGFEFDWSGWDSTVKQEYIVAAFAYCRSLFPESEEIDNAFAYFCHGMVFKTMVTPDGNTFRVTRGVPSGSAWTTVINSVVNALLCEDIGKLYGAFSGKHFDYMVAGDDGVMFWDEEVPFKPEKLVQWIKDRHDMDIEVTKVGVPIAEDPNESLTFNKKCYYWRDGMAVPTTQPKLLAKRLFPTGSVSLTQKSFVDTVTGQYAELLNHDECSLIIGLAAAFMFGAPNGVSYYNSQLTSIILNKELYFSPRPEGILQNDEYSKDKTHPLRSDHIWDGVSPCENVVENWLYDNVTTRVEAPSLRSRVGWFHAKMGLPLPVINLFRKLKRDYSEAYNFLLPQREINQIYKSWKKFYGCDPLEICFSPSGEMVRQPWAP